ncbi:MarR family winged helix-turn-helix transcriptional regulator [Streptomyces chattanoogensis]|uniref:MarR family winged helix-turn-helix transcriptional regulator n=1 Tax=Streptomyces chattanoogensis TaxID=66876 RepID=UPI0036985FFC
MPDPARDQADDQADEQADDRGGGQDPTAALQKVLATLAYLLTRSRAHERHVAEAGVTAARSDLWLLMALEDSGGVSRVGDLAAQLLVEPPHVTRQIGQLEAQDLVERTPDELDRRARKVAITPHGRATLERLNRISQANFRDALAGFDDADIATTVAVLNHLVAYARDKHAHEDRQRGRGA